MCYNKILFKTKSINFSTFKQYYSQQNVRVRFAPSPTGFLHLGGLRTALYNHLFAKKHQGKFILRIEDTDQTRIVEGASDQLYKDLIWSGIEIDEGPHTGGEFGPYVQSKRTDLYREQIEVLLKNGSAYRCFCTNKRLELLRKEAVRTRQIPKYDNRCQHLTENEISKKISSGESFCIRFKLLKGYEKFNDLIYGDIVYDITLNEGDPIVIKSDGFPTYHFANVVDDHLMGITHVLRGVEWQISTTKHLLMYRAFGWRPPLYGHLPLLINADGTKLSKRQGDIKISSYRENGILPQALINYITCSGGGFKRDLEQNIKPKCFTMKELTDQFNLENINVSSGKLMPERLLEYNRLEIERKLKIPEEQQKLCDVLKNLIKETLIDQKSKITLQLDDDHIKKILTWSVNRINKLSDLVSKDLNFLWIIPSHDVRFDSKEMERVSKLQSILNENDDGSFVKENLEILLKRFSQDNDYDYKRFMKLLRTILSGLKEGPGVGEMMEILGKENTLHRIDNFLNHNKIK
ncbi:nondiscriminating glutamyl-tRNA synthetase EARS2, mitochondrial [Onthophagus taurus]|uniref:nondiscriminating glutamyl-tRNA synthetase EARS2, mitochondrial n=1 Tax=Onthophagus taurus TaxID=166361 RepID=UPI0039BE14D8